MRQHLLKQRRVSAPEEAFGGGGAVGATDIIVVQGGQGGQLAVAETVTAVMIQRQVAVAPFHTGTAALEQIGTARGDRFDVGAACGWQGLQRMRWLA